MIQPVINPTNEKTIHRLTKNLPQSLLISGDNGVGISTISKYIAALVKIKPVVILPEKDDKVDLEKGIISVEIMRRLYDETRTKTDSKRIIIIDYAERMTHQAQNAFLKLLEEPGLGLYFILASHSVSKLLPTILSRVVRLDVKHTTNVQSLQLLSDLRITDNTKQSQLLFMAEGLPAELTRLCNDDKYFADRSTIVRDARELIIGSNYRKLKISQKYKDDRPTVLLLLNDVANILKRSIISNPKIDAISRINFILDAYKQIEGGGNIRLCLARMVL